MPSAILYARFSPRPDEDQSESLDYQLAAGRRRAEALGLPIKSEHTDAAASGADIERAGLWDAIAAIEPGDVLIVHKLDRLCRGDAVLPVVLEQIVADRGGRIDSCLNEGTWGDSNDETNWLTRRILQIFNEFARRVTIARTKVAMKRYQATGRLMSARPMFGLAIDPDDPSRTVLDEAEQAAIERIVREYRAGTTQLRGLARLMTEAGILCRGKPWHPQQIKRVLIQSGHLAAATSPGRKKKRIENPIEQALSQRLPQLEFVRAKRSRRKRK